MASHALGAFIDVLPSSISGDTPAHHAVPMVPQRAKSRVYHSVPEGPSDFELENMQFGTKLNGPSETVRGTLSGAQTPIAPNDLEMSRPATPVQDNEAVEAMQSFSNPSMNRYRMIAACLMNFAGGLTDSAPGALIPYIELHYDIGYSIVSLIFITNAVGFILAAFMVDLLRAKLGRARTLFLGNILIMFGYVPIIFAPPFPVVVCCFLPLGLGMAINVALGNVFAANLQNGTTMLGAMHGSYGIGGTLGPLISTAMVTTGGMLWSRYYILTLSVAAFNGLFALWSFWNYEREAASSNLLTNLELTASRAENSSPPSASPSRVPLKKAQFSGMANALKTRTVLLGAVFIFAYQGAEVTISGWVISFLITARGGDPSSVGYVTAGFWLGITIGRFCISPLAHKIGEKLFVYGAIVGAAVFELLVWFVPNIIGDAVAVCIVGLLLGPIFPCAMVVYSRLIRRQDQVSSLSVISAFGSSGGAVAPFTTGILAQAAGTFVLHPIAIGLFAVMITCWLFLPKADKRSE